MMAINPYKMLAWQLYRKLNHLQLRKLLEDPEYATELILEELWDVDYQGVFLDVLFGDMRLLVDKAPIEPDMRRLAESLADKLDMERLRDALLEIAS